MFCRFLSLLLLAGLGIQLGAAAAAAQAPGTRVGRPQAHEPEERSDGASLIRLLPPLPPNKGVLLAETLTLDEAVAKVVFYLDDEMIETRRVPPFEVKVRLAEPARKQLLRVEALDRKGDVVGTDQLEVNRPRKVLRARVQSMELLDGGHGVKVRATVSAPDNVAIESVEVALNELVQHTLDATVEGETFEVTLTRPQPNAQDFVLVRARLEDGRLVEDVQLVEAPSYSEEVEVHLVQLQAVVTDKRGVPILDLTKEDLEVVEGGKVREIDRVYLASEVALVLGLAVDSSGSMQSIWNEAQEASKVFFAETLGDRDRGFVVDFDTNLSLLQPLTGDLGELQSSLENVKPDGGTALYDSILFSLLQFDRQPGRRGLVVLTDGVDSQSRSDPKRMIDLGKRLGTPVYVIAMEQRAPMGGGGGPGLGRGPMGAPLEISSLHLVTDPTGGRLFRSPSLDAVRRAFRQISDELRSQYVVTYYTEKVDELPKVQVRVPGRKGLRIKTIYGQDQLTQ